MPPTISEFGDDHRAAEHGLDVGMQRQAEDRRRQEGDKHVAQEAPGFGLAMPEADEDGEEGPPVEHDHRKDRAELDDDVEHRPVVRIVAEQRAGKDEMAGRRDRDELGDAFDDAEDDQGKQRNIHGTAALAAPRRNGPPKIDLPAPLASTGPARHGGAMRRKARQASKAENRPRFWGRHAVAAALANPERNIVRIWATREAAAALEIDRSIPVTFADVADLGRLVPHDAPHQGLVAEVERLPDILLADLLDEAADRRPLLVLDHVTDPHNVGAILRSAAAFDALGLVTQDRHAPPESGALAKAASGALESVPWARVVNLARALDEMAEAGFWRIGLTGEAEMTLADALGPAAGRARPWRGRRGAAPEYRGPLRRSGAPPDQRPDRESLNVSNAAAVALYAASRRLVLRRDLDTQPVKLGREQDLAGEPASLDAMVGRVEQIVLVGLGRADLADPFRVDMDVAGRAGAAAAAQCEQLVEAVVADILHDAPADAALDRLFGAVAGDDDELGHSGILQETRGACGVLC